jgi:PIN like domain
MKFLLDHPISPNVARAFARLRGRSEVVHMRDWHGGKYIAQHGESDLPWLRVAGREALVIITGDRRTLLCELALLHEQGGVLPGFAIVGAEHQADVGWSARRLLKLENRFSGGPASNIQVFL